MAQKFYAVRTGRDGPNIYKTWEECKRQVLGVPGAIYKSFPTLEEAEAFIGGREAERSVGVGEGGEAPNFSGAVAYVDGSFDKKSGDFSCGAVLFLHGMDEEPVTFSQRFADREMAEMHNVAGEIMGALTVLRYCLEQGVPALKIYHDYEGVGRWADGSWKANKPGTKRYAGECAAARSKIQLSFQKVKGHSGDTYNDMADALARKALGL